MDLVKEMNKLQQRLQELALRWIRAWPKTAGYTWVSNVTYDLENKRVRFSANPMSSGLGRMISIDAKYLDDDSTLEIDSRKQYDIEERARNQRWQRIIELEKLPEVEEYRRLKQEQEAVLYPFHHTKIFV